MAKGDFKGHLWKRGHQWYFRLAIPKPLRPYFLSSTGKPLDRIVEPLGDSRERAKVLATQRLADCVGIFTRIRGGLIKTPDEAKAALYGADDRQAIAEAMRRWNDAAAAIDLEMRARRFEAYGQAGAGLLARAGYYKEGEPAPVLALPATGETISQAAEAWIRELTSDPKEAPQATTLEGHRLRVRAFVEKRGDVLLTDVTRAMASDFLSGLDVARRTRNNYAMTLKCIFECARRRGRFEDDNPFDKQRLKVSKNSYVRFTIEELQTIFDALPRTIKPKKHSPESALPWAALIALYSGARLEEIAQLSTADIRDAEANGGKLTVIDIHNGGANHLKNETAPRLVPMHSALVRAGLLNYVKALPKGPLFPGLKRRASKGGKIGARLGELFRKKLVAVGLKREGLVFHSFRHTVSNTLDRAQLRESDVARVLGHKHEEITFGTYSEEGPGLKIVAATVEKIAYEGLRL
jgi:integrase